ncbi:uncharacterized protein LOC119838202 [Zerene cesonia]|uniref:uncharacterized protein LOC119838202 n=1 Tax=Zerene cesonia TaxID=33412 RepID=UPI0018E5A2BC|nr:uncharacterized protein LOC119838202 [Zerene cesonia]
MSDPPKILVKKIPIILRKKSFSYRNSATDEFLVPFKSNNKIYVEDIIYKAEEKDVLNGEYPNLTIVNKYLNNFFNSTRTVATYTIDDKIIQLNSDEVTKVIGNENYDVILKALCGISETKLKVQAILSLLTISKRRGTAEKCCQTIVTDMEYFIRDKSRRKRPSRCKAYVIDDDHGNISPQTIARTSALRPSKTPIPKTSVRKDNTENLLDLKLIVDEDSNISDASVGNISMISCQIPNILENPKFILENIDKYTQESVKNETRSILKLVDGSTVMLQAKPEDIFHIATANTLRDLSVEDKKRVLLHQAYIDWKFCLLPDQEGNLPIHIAVMNDDIELLKRHCALLKSRNASLDIIGGASVTPLQLSVLKDAPECTRLLLQYGADVLLRDERASSLLHLAAETSDQCIDVILEYCKENARKILQDEEELWRPELEEKSDDELASYLLDRMGEMCNDAGYTPLMAASARGRLAGVRALAGAAPRAANARMATCGDTALYLAVRAAFAHAEQSGNRNKIAQNYLDIIETLHEYGADPLIPNDSGNSVATLTADFKISDLSQAIANKLLMGTNVKKSFEDYILVKDTQGEINVESINTKKRKKRGGGKSVGGDNEPNNDPTVVSGNKTNSKKVIYFNVPSKGKKKKGMEKNIQDEIVAESVNELKSSGKVIKAEVKQEKIVVDNTPVIIANSNVLPVKITPVDVVSKPTDNVTIKNVKAITQSRSLDKKEMPLKINLTDSKILSGINKVVDNKNICTKTPVIIKKSNQIINTGVVKFNIKDSIKVTTVNKLNSNVINTIKINPSEVFKFKDGGPSDSSKPRFIKIIAPSTNKINNLVTKDVNSISNSNISSVSKIVYTDVESGGKVATDNVKIIDNKRMIDTDNIENASIIKHNLKRSGSDIILQLKKKRD